MKLYSVKNAQILFKEKSLCLENKVVFPSKEKHSGNIIWKSGVFRINEKPCYNGNLAINGAWPFHNCYFNGRIGHSFLAFNSQRQGKFSRSISKFFGNTPNYKIIMKILNRFHITNI